MKKFLPILIIVLIIVCAGSFYGGMKYQAGKKTTANFASRDGFPNLANLTPEQIQQRVQQMGGAGRTGNRQGGGGFVDGTIIAKDDKSLTIKSSDSGSKIIFYSATTSVSKFSTGGASDLTIGETVTANGTANQDGSITASTIQLRPETPIQ